MGKVISFFDGREIQFENAIELENFGTVVGMTFSQNRGLVDIAFASVEVGRILSELFEMEEREEKPNKKVLSALRLLDDFYMERSVSLIAKCVIGTEHVKLEQDPPRS